MNKTKQTPENIFFEQLPTTFFEALEDGELQLSVKLGSEFDRIVIDSSFFCDYTYGSPDCKDCRLLARCPKRASGSGIGKRRY
jgi:hypothetical protein